MTTIIEGKNLKRKYGKGANEFFALKGIDIAIEKGESVAIVGKSGSGKSTLMHLLSLMDKASSGQLLLNGEDVSKLKDKKMAKLRNETFGFVFQQFFLNGRDSVFENVMLPLEISGTSYAKKKALVEDVLEKVELTDKMKNKANDLSGGQKQRVCIARALVSEPKILFADEPTGNLDSVTGEAIENLLFKLNKEHGITIIVVTHDEELAGKFDRQIHIKDGEVVA